MKKLLFLIIITLIVFETKAQKLSAEQAKADMKFCYDVLKAAHPSIFRYTKENEFDWIYDFLNRSIVDSIDKSELGEKINVFVSTARCVHTSASNAMNTNSNAYFNFNFLIDKGNLYAKNIKEISPDTSWVKVLSINNIPSSEILSRMMILKSGDGYITTFNDLVFADRFNSFFNVLYKVPGICVIEIETKNGTRKLPVERTLKNTVKDLNYSWDDWQKADTIQSAYFLKHKMFKRTRVLKISKFSKTSKDFYVRNFNRMYADSVNQLVIDLRGNTGGNIYHAFDLLTHLISNDVNMYAERKRNTGLSKYLKLKGYMQWTLAKVLYDVVPNGQRWNEGKLRKYRYSYKSKKIKNFNPEIFVLIDGKSVSSASLVASYLKIHSKAKFIGQETGGTLIGNNGRAFPEIILPNSGIKLRMPLFHITYHIGIPDNGRGVIPDYSINKFWNSNTQGQYIKNILLGKN